MKILPLEQDIKEIDIYVIVSKTSDDFFVWKTKHGNCYITYKHHVNLKTIQTKNLFQKAELDREYPQMFLLETVKTTNEMAYRYCVAWTKYFLFNGKTSLSSNRFLKQVDDLMEDTQAIFDSIKNVPIEKVLADEHSVVANYKKKYPGDKRTQNPKEEIKIYLTPKQYEQVRKRADRQGLSMSRYCKNMALDGHIVTVESPSTYDISVHTAEVRGAKIILRQILYAILQNEKYFPADLENIQKMTDIISQSNAEVGDLLQENTKQLMKLLPK